MAGDWQSPLIILKTHACVREEYFLAISLCGLYTVTIVKGGGGKTMALTKKDLQDIEVLVDTKLTPIHTRLDNLEAMQKALSADVAKLNHYIQPNMELILEHIRGAWDHGDRIKKVEAVQEDHGSRIWAIERKLKAN